MDVRDVGSEAGCDGFGRLLARCPNLMAIICGNDAMAMGAKAATPCPPIPSIRWSSSSVGALGRPRRSGRSAHPVPRAKQRASDVDRPPFSRAWARFPASAHICLSPAPRGAQADADLSGEDRLVGADEPRHGPQVGVEVADGCDTGDGPLPGWRPYSVRCHSRVPIRRLVRIAGVRVPFELGVREDSTLSGIRCSRLLSESTWPRILTCEYPASPSRCCSTAHTGSRRNRSLRRCTGVHRASYAQHRPGTPARRCVKERVALGLGVEGVRFVDRKALGACRAV